VRRLVLRRRLALTIHWAETEEEQEWFESGTGGFATLLPPSPRCRGLELLARAGLLTPRTSLVHGNWPRRDEPEELARRRVTIVHCPGTHAFFARPPFPLQRYRRSGVRVALGTDSLASNEELDMTREMALLRASFPGLAPAEVFAMASERGARALGLGRTIGRLGPGAEADLAGWEIAGQSRAEALEELTAGRPKLARVFVAGGEREVRATGAAIRRDSPRSPVH
jgi:cytosine/adenosine deaminase-related metal-dependent hydrolase